MQQIIQLAERIKGLFRDNDPTQFDELGLMLAAHSIGNTVDGIFDLNKLAWMNGIYIREKLTQDQLIEALQPFTPTDFPMDLMGKILPLVRERLVLLSDLESLTDFFYRDISVNPAELLKKSEAGVVTEQLTRTIAELEQLSQWSVAELETCLRSLQEKYDWKKSQYFMMVRVAVTGKTATPPLFETMEVLGQKETVNRLNQALELL